MNNQTVKPEQTRLGLLFAKPKADKAHTIWKSLVGPYFRSQVTKTENYWDFEKSYIMFRITVKLPLNKRKKTSQISGGLMLCFRLLFIKTKKGSKSFEKGQRFRLSLTKKQKS
uniref:Uncharacterized protein n=1 Tax=Glossina palpalis gambiensis TaxID=67801 RepID=A0A1B0B798_9MUSC